MYLLILCARVWKYTTRVLYRNQEDGNSKIVFVLPKTNMKREEDNLETGRFAYWWFCFSPCYKLHCIILLLHYLIVLCLENSFLPFDPSAGVICSFLCMNQAALFDCIVKDMTFVSIYISFQATNKFPVQWEPTQRNAEPEYWLSAENVTKVRYTVD